MVAVKNNKHQQNNTDTMVLITEKILCHLILQRQWFKNNAQ
jgi:hypothetical protein